MSFEKKDFDKRKLNRRRWEIDPSTRIAPNTIKTKGRKTSKVDWQKALDEDLADDVDFLEEE